MGRRFLPAAATAAIVATLLLSVWPNAVQIGRFGGPAAATRAAIDINGPGEEVLSRDAPAPGINPSQAYRDALTAANRAAARTAIVDPALASDPWTFQGPTNIGGRVTDLALDTAHSGTVYIATAGGGVWKSTDAGATFTSVWPIDLTQAIGAIAIGSDGVIYVGTGESGPGGGSITYGGTGVYRSTDGGVTWQLVGLQDSGTIARIVVDPTNAQRVFAAVTGNLFVPGGQRGVYLSTDGGTTWNQVLAPANTTTGAVDIAIDPENTQRMYAAMWDHIRYPDLRVYGGAGSGVYRSTDGGVTWTRLNVTSADPTTVGRIGVAVAPSNSNDVYAIITATDGNDLGVFASTDGGTTFTMTGDPSTDQVLAQSQSTYGWWFGRITVDPAVPTRLIAGGVFLTESTSSGSAWHPLDPSVFSDQHDIVFDPTSTGRVYVASDGGVYTSIDDGFTYSHATYEPWQQLDSIDVSMQDGTRIVGGSQDVGDLRSYSGTASGGGPSAWNVFGPGGDGEKTLIEPDNDQIVYACTTYGSCDKSTDGGDVSLPIGSTTSARANWFSPMEFDPSDPTVVYWAGDQVNRSTDSGSTFTAISPDLSGGPGRDPIYTNYGTVTTLAASPLAAGFIIAGTDDGRIQTTRDGGATWVLATDPILPHAWVTRVMIDPVVATTVYATFSGFRGGNESAYVFKSTDQGASWSDISGDLPRAPVNKILAIGSALYVGTDVGVFRTQDGGTTWLRVGSGLPQAPVYDLRYRPASQTLYVATYGRGAWSIDLSQLAATIPESSIAPVLVMSGLGGVAFVLLRRRGRLQKRLANP